MPTHIASSRYDDDPLVFEEFEADGKMVRVSMDDDLVPVVCIETTDGPLRQMTIRGEGLGLFLTNAGERIANVSQRLAEGRAA